METEQENRSSADVEAKLEFRVVPSKQELTNAGVNVEKMIDKLEQEGPVRSGTTEYVWQKIKRPRDPDNPDQRGSFLEFSRNGPLVVGTYQGTRYVLASNKPEETMLYESKTAAWKLSECYPTEDQWNRPAVGFKFNQAGTKRFWELTKAHKNRNLGIFYNNEAISAPNINTPIYQSGIIEGNLSKDEVRDMVNQLGGKRKNDNLLFKLFK